MPEVVVISGAGITTSLGHTIGDVWNSLMAGETGIRPFQQPGVTGEPEDPGFSAATVSGLDPAGLGIHPRDARIMGRHSHMLIKASRDALNTAGIDRKLLAAEEIGFYAGMGMVDYTLDDLLPAAVKSSGDDGRIDHDRFFATAFHEIHPLWPLSMLNNISFCQAAIGLDIRGENTVFSPHADSGAQAISEAVRMLLDRKARLVLAGGVSETVSCQSLARARCFDVLATGKTPPLPFGAGRQGTVLGEGCGILSLELKSSADSRGARYSTMITGYGSACDRDEKSNCPTARGITLAMRQALECAGVSPDGIDLVIAHGDGTIDGDRSEAEALGMVFKDCLERLPVYSSKSALGHMLAAGPAVDVMLGSAMIEQAVVPSIAGSYEADRAVKFRLLNKKSLSLRPRRILVNGLSYEGQCSSLIIEAVSQEA